MTNEEGKKMLPAGIDFLGYLLDELCLPQLNKYFNVI